MSDWTPVHHVEAEDPDGEPAKGPTKDKSGKDGSGEAKAAVGLTLELPKEFISAMWGYGDQVMRLAMAIEEQNKILREMLTKPPQSATSGT
jgi:hypothetical protein